jgi:hypothetical protein
VVVVELRSTVGCGSSLCTSSRIDVVVIVAVVVIEMYKY